MPPLVRCRFKIQIMNNTIISAFANCKAKEGKETTLRAWLSDKSHIELVNRIRSTSDKDERTKLKALLPCATLSGLFSTRNAEGLLKHSGYLCIDIDASDNPNILDFDDLRDQLSHISNVAYCSLSVSGKGCFCLIRILNPEKHKEHFEAFKIAFQKLNIIIDKSCGDVTRLRYYSYDENAYYNFENAIPFDGIVNSHSATKITVETKKRNVRRSQGNDSRDKIHLIISKIVSTETDITGDYKQWFEIGSSLASAFGEGARELFHAVSRFSDKYNEHSTDKQYDACLTCCHQFTIGTFIYYASEQGIS